MTVPARRPKPRRGQAPHKLVVSFAAEDIARLRERLADEAER